MKNQRVLLSILVVSTITSLLTSCSLKVSSSAAGDADKSFMPPGNAEYPYRFVKYYHCSEKFAVKYFGKTGQLEKGLSIVGKKKNSNDIVTIADSINMGNGIYEHTDLKTFNEYSEVYLYKDQKPIDTLVLGGSLLQFENTYYNDEAVNITLDKTSPVMKNLYSSGSFIIMDNTDKLTWIENSTFAHDLTITKKNNKLEIIESSVGRNLQFSGDVCQTVIQNDTIQGNVVYQNCILEKDSVIQFSNVLFGKKLLFDNCKLDGTLVFDHCTLPDTIEFRNTQVPTSKSIDFRHCFLRSDKPCALSVDRNVEIFNNLILNKNFEVVFSKEIPPEQKIRVFTRIEDLCSQNKEDVDYFKRFELEARVESHKASPYEYLKYWLFDFGYEPTRIIHITLCFFLLFVLLSSYDQWMLGVTYLSRHVYHLDNSYILRPRSRHSGIRARKGVFISPRRHPILNFRDSFIYVGVIFFSVPIHIKHFLTHGLRLTTLYIWIVYLTGVFFIILISKAIIETMGGKI